MSCSPVPRTGYAPRLMPMTKPMRSARSSPPIANLPLEDLILRAVEIDREVGEVAAVDVFAKEHGVALP